MQGDLNSEQESRAGQEPIRRKFIPNPGDDPSFPDIDDWWRLDNPWLGHPWDHPTNWWPWRGPRSDSNAIDDFDAHMALVSSPFDNLELPPFDGPGCIDINAYGSFQPNKYLPAVTTDPEKEKENLAKEWIKVILTNAEKSCHNQHCHYKMDGMKINKSCEIDVSLEDLKRYFKHYLNRIKNEADCWSRQALNPVIGKNTFTMGCNKKKPRLGR